MFNHDTFHRAAAIINPPLVNLSAQSNQLFRFCESEIFGYISILNDRVSFFALHIPSKIQPNIYVNRTLRRQRFVVHFFLLCRRKAGYVSVSRHHDIVSRRVEIFTL